jgi:O-antigen ligase
LLLLVALAFTFSITSMAALITGLVAVSWLGLGPRTGLVAAAACVAVAIGLAVVGPSEDARGSSGINEATSGRVDLIEGGLELAQDRPIGGWGSGSFGRAFVTEIEATETTTSHAEPITVVAEQGVVGLAVFVLLIGASLVVLVGRGAGASIARTAVAACYLGLLAHSLGYAAFAIDPVTWALLGVGLALARDDASPAASGS